MVRMSVTAMTMSPVAVPPLPGPPVATPLSPSHCPLVTDIKLFQSNEVTYLDAIEMRLASGQCVEGPCAMWFRARVPLVEGHEEWGPMEREVLAGDSAQGISGAMDVFRNFL
jgi:hypothetical protein